ncbi:MAG: hypothetical protein ACPGRT_03925, partial [Flavobacteriaceae bacterium]
AKAMSEIKEYLGIQSKSAYSHCKEVRNKDTIINKIASRLFKFGKKFYFKRRKNKNISKIENAIKNKVYEFLLALSINRKTQLHPNHVSKNKGFPGAWKHELNPEELRIFENETQKHPLISLRKSNS